jgi:hypothetical protein
MTAIPPWVVEQPRRDRQLADVVEQRRPAQPVAVLGRQVSFLGDEVGQRLDALGMPAGPPVVLPERHDEREHALGLLRGVPRRPVPGLLLGPGLQPARVRGAQRDREAGGRSVREQQ